MNETQQREELYSCSRQIIDMASQLVKLAARIECVFAQPGVPNHYPPGMGDESRRLHREYNRLVAAQSLGEHNSSKVIALTDECAAKGIILVPGGELL